MLILVRSTIAVVFEYRSGKMEPDIFRRAQSVVAYSQQNDGLQLSNVYLIKPAQQELDLDSLKRVVPSVGRLPHSAAGLETKNSHILCLEVSNSSASSIQVYSEAPFEGSLDPTKLAFGPTRLYASPPVCPLCNKDTVLRRGQVGCFLNCIAYPECLFFRETFEPCDSSAGMLVAPSCIKCRSARVPFFAASGLVWRCPTAECDGQVLAQAELDRLDWHRLTSGPSVTVAPWSTVRMLIPIHPSILQREVVEEMRRALVVPLSIVIGAPKLAKRKVPHLNSLIRAALKWLLRFQWRSGNRTGYLSADGAADLLSSPMLLDPLFPPPCRISIDFCNYPALAPAAAGSESSSSAPLAAGRSVICNQLVSLRVTVQRIPTTLPMPILEATGPPPVILDPRFTVSVVCNSSTLEEQRASSWLPSRMTWIGKNLNLDLPNPLGIRESLVLPPDAALPFVDVSFLIHAPGVYQFTAAAVDVRTQQVYWSLPIQLAAAVEAEF